MELHAIAGSERLGGTALDGQSGPSFQAVYYLVGFKGTDPSVYDVSKRNTSLKL